MFNTITNLFLHTYFMFESVAGKLVGNSRLLFDKLYSAFLLPETEREKLFAATQAEVVREIETYGNYAQICRIQKLSAHTDLDGIPVELREIIAVKGSALKTLKQNGHDKQVDETETSVCNFLNDTANEGLVSSLYILGFLQCEGMFISKNEKLGRKNLNKAAVWNSVEGILLALAYDESNRQKNLDRLYTITCGTIYDGISNSAQKAYLLREAKLAPENKLLKKAFGAAILKSDVYVSQYARFIFSDVLSFKDKERALFSGHREVVSETADLPLKLHCESLAFAPAAIRELPLKREVEQDKICNIISYADMRSDPAFRPLCVHCDSNYLLDLHVAAIGKAFPSAHIERIDVADLVEYDFEPTKNNVFVRSCDEDKQNVFIITCKGELRVGALNAVKNFLQSDKRKKFRLQHPGVEIDLSAVLPVCFCDKQNVAALKPYCDVVTIAAVNATEKYRLVSYVLHEKSTLYNVADLQMDAEAKDALMSYSIDNVERVLDRTLRYNRGLNCATLTAELLKEFSGGDSCATNKYGFGGAGNEIK